MLLGVLHNTPRCVTKHTKVCYETHQGVLQTHGVLQNTPCVTKHTRCVTIHNTPFHKTHLRENLEFGQTKNTP